MGAYMNTIIPYIPLLLKGAGITLASWILASLGGICIGILCGILSCRSFAQPIMLLIIKLYILIAKGVPAYVQILIAYFAIPSLLGINISGFFAATGALIFCSGGYTTEIIRTGIDSIPQGQWDACFVLGYSKWNSLIRIIAPQTVQLIMPMLVGESEHLLKATSLLATIGVTELTRSGMNIISRELNPLPIYLIVAVFYVLFSIGLTSIAALAKKRLNYGNS